MTINMLFLQILFFCFFIVFIVITVSYKIPNVITKGMKLLPCRSYDNIDQGTFRGEKITWSQCPSGSGEMSFLHVILLYFL